VTSERRRAIAGTLARVALAAAGLVAIAFLVGEKGFRDLREALPRVVPVLPACVGLELARIGFESLATRSAAGELGPRIPVGRLLLAHFVAYAALVVAPAPRAVAETAKATLFARWVGAAEAAAIGTIVQSATFVGVGAMSAICGSAVVLRSEGGLLVPLLFGNTVFLFVLGFGMAWIVRSPRVVAWVVARLEKRFDVKPIAARFEAVFARSPFVMVRPAAWLAAGMVCQVIELGLVARALVGTCSLAGAFAAHGAHLVSASAAVLVPGQLGARELAFTLAAGPLGTDAAGAAAIALVWRGIQLAIAPLGFLVLGLWRVRERSA